MQKHQELPAHRWQYGTLIFAVNAEWTHFGGCKMSNKLLKVSLQKQNTAIWLKISPDGRQSKKNRDKPKWIHWKV